MNIIDIPDEYEQEVVENIEDESHETITSTLTRLLRTFDEKGCFKIIKIFPHLVAAIDNPSKKIKSLLTTSEYRFANNLTKDEVQEIINEKEPWELEGMIGNNRKVVEQIIEIDSIVEFMLNCGDDCLDSYKKTNKHKEAKRLYNLANM